jgi:hypothetical protein
MVVNMLMCWPHSYCWCGGSTAARRVNEDANVHCLQNGLLLLAAGQIVKGFLASSVPTIVHTPIIDILIYRNTLRA